MVGESSIQDFAVTPRKSIFEYNRKTDGGGTCESRFRSPG